MDWLDIKCVTVVCQNISWTCIKFYSKNKRSNIIFDEDNVNVKNVIVEANSIYSIDAINLNISNPFNDPDCWKIKNKK